jgi:hypothetical protein
MLIFLYVDEVENFVVGLTFVALRAFCCSILNKSSVFFLLFKLNIYLFIILPMIFITRVA